ncbi:MAG: TlpA disulfide reductase family protein [Alistipes sp.]|nr:TlpA disulfide reductase family protein [Alistipes sp.]
MKQIFWAFAMVVVAAVAWACGNANTKAAAAAEDDANKYINVVTKDLQGKTTSLEDVVENGKNKYVLLDFWASWCGPCMGEMPHLKKAYEAYHDKGFEIFAVSFDNSVEDCSRAVVRVDLPWIHTMGNDKAANDYGVNSIPSNFLIDCKSGKIIASNLRGEAVAEKLAELLD